MTADPAPAAHRTADVTSTADKLRDALTGTRPFASLWDSLSSSAGETDAAGARATEHRLYQHLVQCLALGATVVIVYAPSPEIQLIVSRALLDAGCDILLTHEILAPAIDHLVRDVDCPCGPASCSARS